MAKSQSHKLGEFIGTFFEDLMKKPIGEFADKYGLFFDTNRSRKARNNRKTLSWTDYHGNEHRLDFVLEKGGTENTFGDILDGLVLESDFLDGVFVNASGGSDDEHFVTD